MIRYFRYIFYGFLALLLLGTGFFYAYQDQIMDRLKKSLNEQLLVPVHTEKIELSIIRDFPNIQLKLTNVTALESSSFSRKGDTLLHLEELGVSFDLFAILRNEIKLIKCSASNGYIDLKINRQNQRNFEILKPDTSTSDFYLQLNKATFKEVLFQYRDARENQVLAFDLEKVSLSGNIDNDNFEAAFYGTFQVRDLLDHGNDYSFKYPLYVDVILSGSEGGDVLSITRGILTINDNLEFDLNGTLSQNYSRLQLKSEQLNLADLIKKLPPAFSSIKRDRIKKGFLDIDLIVLNESGKVSYHGMANLIGGMVKVDSSDIPLKIEFKNADFQSISHSNLNYLNAQIEQFNLNQVDFTAEGKCSFRWDRSLTFQLESQGNIDLSQINKRFETVYLDGNIAFDIKSNGYLNLEDTLTISSLNNIAIAGSASCMEVKLHSQELDINHLSSEVLFDNKKAALKTFRADINDLSVEGALLVEGWRRIIDGHPYESSYSGNLTIEELQLERYLVSDDTGSVELTDVLNYDLNIHTRIRHFSMDKFQGSNAHGYLRTEEGRLFIDDFSMEALEGFARANIEMSRGLSGGARLQSEGILEGIDINQLFYEMNNFGQQAIVDKHLSGKGNALFEASLELDSNYRVMLPSIEVEADITIAKGEVKEYAPLYSIPKAIEEQPLVGLFIKLDDFEQKLHHIYFKDLNNHITVRDEVVSIPAMSVSSSALDIDLQGNHSFTNQVDYYIRFNLKDVLIKKKNQQTEFGWIKDDGTGNQMMFIHVYGDGDDPKVELDKESSRKYRNSEIKKRMDEALDVLKFKNSQTDTVDVEATPISAEIDTTLFFEALDTKPDSVDVQPKDTVKDNNLIRKILGPKKDTARSSLDDWDFEEDDL
ncbi:MAG TPA: hypothetical protein DDX92_08985 [Flavobacteriales bacterium]|nr:hypothetical protein [Flavobacteriales bacterium]